MLRPGERYRNCRRRCRTRASRAPPVSRPAPASHGTTTACSTPGSACSVADASPSGMSERDADGTAPPAVPFPAMPARQAGRGQAGWSVGDKPAGSVGDNVSSVGDNGVTGSVVVTAGGVGGVTRLGFRRPAAHCGGSVVGDIAGDDDRQPGRMSSGSVSADPSGWTRPMLAATTSSSGTWLSAASCDNVSPSRTGTVLSPALSPIVRRGGDGDRPAGFDVVRVGEPVTVGFFPPGVGRPHRGPVVDAVVGGDLATGCPPPAPSHQPAGCRRRHRLRRPRAGLSPAVVSGMTTVQPGCSTVRSVVSTVPSAWTRPWLRSHRSRQAAPSPRWATARSHQVRAPSPVRVTSRVGVTTGATVAAGPPGGPGTSSVTTAAAGW